MRKRINDEQRDVSYGELVALQQEFETQLDENHVIFDNDDDYDEALNDFIQQYIDGDDDPQINWENAKVRPVRDSKRRRVRDGRRDGRGIDFDDYNCLVNNYGHLLSLDDVTGGDEFADLIKRTYSLDNERNAYFYELAKNLMFVTRHRNGFNYYVSDSRRSVRDSKRIKNGTWDGISDAVIAPEDERERCEDISWGELADLTAAFDRQLSERGIELEDDEYLDMFTEFVDMYARGEEPDVDVLY